MAWFRIYSVRANRKKMITKKGKHSTAVKRGNEEQKKLVKSSNDNKIDQDFPGFPHGHAKENIINPKTNTEKKIADVNNKDGEKRNRKEIDESRSDGSGGAFNATEEVRE